MLTKLIHLFKSYPKTVLRQLSLSNIKKLIHALKHESPSVIFENIRAFLSKHQHTSKSQVRANIDDFAQSLSKIEEPINNLFIIDDLADTSQYVICSQLIGNAAKNRNKTVLLIAINEHPYPIQTDERFQLYTIQNNQSKTLISGEVQYLLEKLNSNTSKKKAHFLSAKSIYLTPIVKEYYDQCYHFGNDLPYLYSTDDWHLLKEHFEHVTFSHPFYLEEEVSGLDIVDKWSTDLLSINEKALKNHKDEHRVLIRKKLDIAQGAKIVLAIGGPYQHLGMDIFIKSAITYLSTYKKEDVYFIWLGNLPLTDNLKWAYRDIESAGFRDRIRVLDNDQNYLPWIYGSDLYLWTVRKEPDEELLNEIYRSGIKIISLQEIQNLIKISDTNIVEFCIYQGIFALLEIINQDLSYKENAS